jgi:phospholipid-binding lipoprotein MlaA
MKMLSRNTRSELCCFTATCCGVGAFLLVVFALDLTIDAPMSEARILVLVGAGIAFVLMIMLTGIAVQIGRADLEDVGPREPCTGSARSTTRVSADSAGALKAVMLLVIVATLAACATGIDPRDPYESFNRGVYQFNDGVDKAVMQPAARAYRAVLPSFVRTGIGNVLSNVGDVRNVLNNALQGKLQAAYEDVGRILINSTLGFGGLFDIASAAGVEKHNEDFGQTLGVWGMDSGSFLVLPILGPTSTRDAVGRLVDYTTDPLTYVDPASAGFAAHGTDAVDTRSQLLEAGTILKDSTLDPYLFVRDAYFQRRGALVRDGRPEPAAEDARVAGSIE